LTTPIPTLKVISGQLCGTLTGDEPFVHTKAALATRTIFGKPIAHRLLILAIGGGLMLRVGAPSVPKSTIALYELAKARFVVLTEISDTIHVETEVVQVGALDERRLISVGHRRVNQGEVVCASCSHHRQGHR
jgi:acyl dehydratase